MGVGGRAGCYAPVETTEAAAGRGRTTREGSATIWLPTVDVDWKVNGETAEGLDETSHDRDRSEEVTHVS